MWHHATTKSAHVQFYFVYIWWHSISTDSELHLQPQKAAPKGHWLFNVRCFSLCLLDVHSGPRRLVTRVWVNGTTQSPGPCWYSCLSRGSTTAPEEKGQSSGRGPLVVTFLPAHLPQIVGVKALTAEFWVQSRSRWPHPTGLYSPTGLWLFTCCLGGCLLCCGLLNVFLELVHTSCDKIRWNQRWES